MGTGLAVIVDNNSIRALAELIIQYRLIEVYVEHESDVVYNEKFRKTLSNVSSNFVNLDDM